METIGKVAAVAIVAALCITVVKQRSPEIGLVLALCAGAIILTVAMSSMSAARELMDTLADTAGLSPAVIAPVLKTVGIAILTRIAGEICRDAKEGGLAAFVDTAGAAAAIFVCLPLMRTVLTMITGLL